MCREKNISTHVLLIARFLQQGFIEPIANRPIILLVL